MSKENLDKEIKLDTSFDLLKTDGFDLSSVGIIKKNEETTDDESDKKEEKQENVEEKKEETNLKDIKNIFEIANNNVREATTIFNKNIDLKKKLDEELQEIKQLREENEKRVEEEKEKIKAYKEEVFESLKEKKIEVEKQLDYLKNQNQDL